MRKNQLENLLKRIQKEYQIFAPTQKDKEFFITKVEKIKDINFSGKIPLNSWKELFFPPCEKLFDFKKSYKKATADHPQVCAFNMTILDLKALGLYDLVFEDDPYYEERHRKILVVGLLAGAPSRQNFAKFKIFSLQIEENILEHIPFDISLQKSKLGNFKVYSGSVKGQELLEKWKIRDYENVKFAGLIPEEGPDKKMQELEKGAIAKPLQRNTSKGSGHKNYFPE